ncbi:MAG: septal ring lytic transglycosylase RlpA family protein [Hyphomicrobiales bacterium]|nr:septal ring lytic transglycosylase RlpA family protein [Hyphomicrobiales bacterium]
MAKNAGPTKRLPLIREVLVASTFLALAGCSATQNLARTAGVEPIERVVGPHDKVAPGGGRYQVGRAYTINGRTYVPKEDPHYDAVGIASWYGGDFHHGTRTANGEVYDRGTLTAAHPTMPLPSYARVTSLTTGKSIIVRVNDRGPYAGNRIIDISEKTAQLLEIKGRGISKVRVQYVGRAGLAGSDQKMLMASLRGPGVSAGVDDHRLIAAADLPVGPRRDTPAPTLVADASAARPANALAPTRPSLPTNARALVATSDPTAFELAGVAPVRTAASASFAKPASSSAAVIEAEMPGADGAPMSLTPPPTTGTFDTSALPAAADRRASYAAETRISAAFERLGQGDAFAHLAR